jgi:hypothetical protein
VNTSHLLGEGKIRKETGQHCIHEQSVGENLPLAKIGNLAEKIQAGLSGKDTYINQCLEIIFRPQVSE